MGYIYCITNKINQKKYIGKTLNTVENRWKEHLKVYKCRKYEKRALYDAMNKYGVNNFECETIGEFPDNILEEMEQKFIKEYNTYHYGYNLTIGGDGKQLYEYDKIIEYYVNNDVTIVATSVKFNCSVDTVKDILNNHNIPKRSQRDKYFGNCKIPKQIDCFDKDGNFIRTFNSVSDAGRWIFEIGKCKKLISGVRGHIADCANGKQNTAYGYKWKYK
jgi:group I intron endonuclease